ncbi:diaminopimelate epimerase [Chloroflexota bacterium]
MNFTKMQGAGNDYVLLETGDTHRDWSQLAIAICDRHFGIGADSLLLLLPSEVAQFKMRIFDLDGSEAEACGNGIRCLAKYVFEKGLINSGTDEISVETVAGIRKIKLYKKMDKLVGIQANMGKPEFEAEKIPVVIKKDEGHKVDIISMLSYPVIIDETELILNLVSMGNPHAVCFWQHPVPDFPLSQLGPKVERLAIFPNRVNFEVARVVNRQRIEARAWERGVGETLACGSGACAIAVAAQLHGYIDNKVDIKLPGGLLGVEWDGTGDVLLSGPAEIVFAGEWPDEV